MVLGIIVGYMIFIGFPDKKVASQIAGYISILSDIFLRLIKMLIGPLVFSTLGGRDRAPRRRRLDRPGVREGARVVHRRLAGVAGPGPRPRQLAPARA
jgi:hypothetical protein